MLIPEKQYRSLQKKNKKIKQHNCFQYWY